NRTSGWGSAVVSFNQITTERKKMRMRTTLAVLGALVALSATFASAAQAEAVGPYWKYNKTRFEAGETSALTAAAVNPLVFHFGASFTVTCSKQSLEGGLLSGSSGSNPGTITA